MKRGKTKYHTKLKELIDNLAHRVYDVIQSFPKNEQFGVTSQFRRAALSVVLNYIEGYARQRKAVLKQFLEISYGSLKETKYLVGFSYKRKYILEKDYRKLYNLCNEISRMLWGILSKM